MKICRMISAVFFVTLILFRGPHEAFADESEPEFPERLTIGSLANYAYNKNPTILAAKEEWRAAI
jgi:hypothetical protein